LKLAEGLERLVKGEQGVGIYGKRSCKASERQRAALVIGLI